MREEESNRPWETVAVKVNPRPFIRKVLFDKMRNTPIGSTESKRSYKIKHTINTIGIYFPQLGTDIDPHLTCSNTIGYPLHWTIRVSDSRSDNNVVFRKLYMKMEYIAGRLEFSSPKLAVSPRAADYLAWNAVGPQYDNALAVFLDNKPTLEAGLNDFIIDTSIKTLLERVYFLRTHPKLEGGYWVEEQLNPSVPQSGAASRPQQVPKTNTNTKKTKEKKNKHPMPSQQRHNQQQEQQSIDDIIAYLQITNEPVESAGAVQRRRPVRILVNERRRFNQELQRQLDGSIDIAGHWVENVIDFVTGFDDLERLGSDKERRAQIRQFVSNEMLKNHLDRQATAFQVLCATIENHQKYTRKELLGIVERKERDMPHPFLLISATTKTAFRCLDKVLSNNDFWPEVGNKELKSLYFILEKMDNIFTLGGRISDFIYEAHYESPVTRKEKDAKPQALIRRIDLSSSKYQYLLNVSEGQGGNQEYSTITAAIKEDLGELTKEMMADPEVKRLLGKVQFLFVQRAKEILGVGIDGRSTQECLLNFPDRLNALDARLVANQLLTLSQINNRIHFLDAVDSVKRPIFTPEEMNELLSVQEAYLQHENKDHLPSVFRMHSFGKFNLPEYVEFSFKQSRYPKYSLPIYSIHNGVPGRKMLTISWRKLVSGLQKDYDMRYSPYEILEKTGQLSPSSSWAIDKNNQPFAHVLERWAITTTLAKKEARLTTVEAIAHVLMSPVLPVPISNRFNAGLVKELLPDIELEWFSQLPDHIIQRQDVVTLILGSALRQPGEVAKGVINDINLEGFDLSHIKFNACTFNRVTLGAHTILPLDCSGLRLSGCFLTAKHVTDLYLRGYRDFAYEEHSQQANNFLIWRLTDDGQQAQVELDVRLVQDDIDPKKIIEKIKSSYVNVEVTDDLAQIDLDEPDLSCRDKRSFGGLACNREQQQKKRLQQFIRNVPTDTELQTLDLYRKDVGSGELFFKSWKITVHALAQGPVFYLHLRKVGARIGLKVLFEVWRVSSEVIEKVTQHLAQLDQGIMQTKLSRCLDLLDSTVRSPALITMRHSLEKKLIERGASKERLYSLKRAYKKHAEALVSTLSKTSVVDQLGRPVNKSNQSRTKNTMTRLSSFLTLFNAYDSMQSLAGEGDSVAVLSLGVNDAFESITSLSGHTLSKFSATHQAGKNLLKASNHKMVKYTGNIGLFFSVYSNIRVYAEGESTPISHYWMARSVQQSVQVTGKFAVKLLAGSRTVLILRTGLKVLGKVAVPLAIADIIITIVLSAIDISKTLKFLESHLALSTKQKVEIALKVLFQQDLSYYYDAVNMKPVLNGLLNSLIEILEQSPNLSAVSLYPAPFIRDDWQEFMRNPRRKTLGRATSYVVDFNNMFGAEFYQYDYRHNTNTSEFNTVLPMRVIRHGVDNLYVPSGVDPYNVPRMSDSQYRQGHRWLSLPSSRIIPFQVPRISNDPIAYYYDDDRINPFILTNKNTWGNDKPLDPNRPILYLNAGIPPVQVRQRRIEFGPQLQANNEASSVIVVKNGGCNHNNQEVLAQTSGPLHGGNHRPFASFYRGSHHYQNVFLTHGSPNCSELIGGSQPTDLLRTDGLLHEPTIHVNLITGLMSYEYEDPRYIEYRKNNPGYEWYVGPIQTSWLKLSSIEMVQGGALQTLYVTPNCKTRYIDTAGLGVINPLLDKCSQEREAVEWRIFNKGDKHYLHSHKQVAYFPIKSGLDSVTLKINDDEGIGTTLLQLDTLLSNVEMWGENNGEVSVIAFEGTKILLPRLCKKFGNIIFKTKDGYSWSIKKKSIQRRYDMLAESLVKSQHQSQLLNKTMSVVKCSISGLRQFTFMDFLPLPPKKEKLYNLHDYDINMAFKVTNQDDLIHPRDMLSTQPRFPFGLDIESITGSVEGWEAMLLEGSASADVFSSEEYSQKCTTYFFKGGENNDTYVVSANHSLFEQTIIIDNEANWVNDHYGQDLVTFVGFNWSHPNTSLTLGPIMGSSNSAMSDFLGNASLQLRVSHFHETGQLVTAYVYLRNYFFHDRFGHIHCSFDDSPILYEFSKTGDSIKLREPQPALSSFPHCDSTPEGITFWFDAANQLTQDMVAAFKLPISRNGRIQVTCIEMKGPFERVRARSAWHIVLKAQRERSEALVEQTIVIYNNELLMLDGYNSPTLFFSNWDNELGTSMTNFCQPYVLGKIQNLTARSIGDPVINKDRQGEPEHPSLSCDPSPPPAYLQSDRMAVALKSIVRLQASSATRPNISVMFALPIAIAMNTKNAGIASILTLLWAEMLQGYLNVEASCAHRSAYDNNCVDEDDESGIYARNMDPEFIVNITPVAPQTSNYFDPLLHHDFAEKVHWVYQAIKYAGKLVVSVIPGDGWSHSGGMRYEPYVGDANLEGITHGGITLLYMLAMKRNSTFGNKKIQESEIEKQNKIIEREYKAICRKKLFTQLQYWQLKAIEEMLKFRCVVIRVIKGIDREGVTALCPVLHGLIGLYRDLISISKQLELAEDRSLLVKRDSLKAFHGFIRSHPNCVGHEFQQRYYKFLEEYISINNTPPVGTKRVSQARLERLLERVSYSLNEDVADLHEARALSQDCQNAVGDYRGGQLDTSELMASFEQSGERLQALSRNSNLARVAKSQRHSDFEGAFTNPVDVCSETFKEVIRSKKAALVSTIKATRQVASGFMPSLWSGSRKAAANQSAFTASQEALPTMAISL